MYQTQGWRASVRVGPWGQTAAEAAGERRGRGRAPPGQGAADGRSREMGAGRGREGPPRGEGSSLF